MTAVVLTVGALDPLGADGLAADLRTFAALGVHGAAAAATVGDPGQPLEPAQVVRQIAAALAGGRVVTVKFGDLGSAAVARAVAEALSGIDAPIISDPSFAGTGAGDGADRALVETWREVVLPLAAVVTPNLAEAALLTGTGRAITRGEMMQQAEALVGLGCAHAVVSGGHGTSETSTDLIASRDRPPLEMRAERLERGAMRGLSATFAASIAAHAAHGIALFEAVQMAKLFTSNAIGEAERNADGRPLFPNQMARIWQRAGSEGSVGGGA